MSPAGRGRDGNLKSQSVIDVTHVPRDEQSVGVSGLAAHTSRVLARSWKPGGREQDVCKRGGKEQGARPQGSRDRKGGNKDVGNKKGGRAQESRNQGGRKPGGMKGESVEGVRRDRTQSWGKFGIEKEIEGEKMCMEI